MKGRDDMRAIVLEQYGGPEVMRMREVPTPEFGPEEIRVAVSHTALNRADLVQRIGKYPPPPPAPEHEILGLEFSGTVEAVGSRVTRWKPGDRVFGLLNGGGYAEKVVLHEHMALPVPEGMAMAEAAGIAEVFLTAYDALLHRGRIQAGEQVLIHAGGSGVGTAAIQLANTMGATVFTTVGSPEKAAQVEPLGARTIVYREQDFVQFVQKATRGRGVDVILDFIGSPYLDRNMQAAASLGRIVQIGLLGGAQADIDLGLLMSKRLTLVGTGLRYRTLGEKLTLTREFAERMLPLFANRRMRPVIDREFDWTDVAEAHEYMASNKNIGKIVLRVGE